MFGSLGTRDGIDMHEFIEAAGGIEKNETEMLTNKNTAESKSCHRPWEKHRGREGNVSNFEQETISSVQPWKITVTHQYPVSVQQYVNDREEVGLGRRLRRCP